MPLNSRYLDVDDLSGHLTGKYPVAGVGTRSTNLVAEFVDVNLFPIRLNRNLNIFLLLPKL